MSIARLTYLMEKMRADHAEFAKVVRRGLARIGSGGLDGEDLEEWVAHRGEEGDEALAERLRRDREEG